MSKEEDFTRLSVNCIQRVTRVAEKSCSWITRRTQLRYRTVMQGVKAAMRRAFDTDYRLRSIAVRRYTSHLALQVRQVK